MNFVATKQKVANRGVPPDSFLTQLVQWGKVAPEVIFSPRSNKQAPDDVYNLIKPVLGPWELDERVAFQSLHRRAAMLELMRVLAGFESSWKWNEGVDTSNPRENSPETISAGAWQISWNSRNFGDDLKTLLAGRSVTNGVEFQQITKIDHPFAMEYAARLFRHTTQHNGPLKRHEVNPNLKRDAVAEFQALLSA